MATSSLKLERGVWYVYFRPFGGKQQHKSLKTNDKKEATRRQAIIERNLDELERGRQTLPEGADLWQFLWSDGTRTEKPKTAASVTLGKMIDDYFARLPEGAKEKNTIETERLHAKHLRREIGSSKPVAAIDWPTLQGYVNSRSRKVGRITIGKELATLRMIWNRSPDVLSPYPAPKEPGQKLVFPKGEQKAPFDTYAAIAARIKKDGLSEDEAASLWERVFLSVEEVQAVLCYAEERRQTNSYWFPLLAFVAYTGARRSEAARSRRDDIDFEHKRVIIREKKRDRTVIETTRIVPMTSGLERALREWFEVHPGGPYTFCLSADSPVSPDSLGESWNWFFRDRADADPKWSVLPGFHVFRHSFASNLARKGLDQRVIDDMMGHQTEAMRQRYRHLFPEVRAAALNSVFGE